MNRITRQDLKRELDNGSGIVLVEALPEQYWKQGHIPGAIQIDHTEIKDKAPGLLPDKDARIVVYCANTQCQNSANAVKALQSLGYKNVREYVEGKQDWQEAELPLESSE